jgi:hypothetical protein
MAFSLSKISAYARPEAHLTKQTFHGAVGGLQPGSLAWLALVASAPPTR